MVEEQEPMNESHSESWLTADEYARSLRGLTINLPVADIAPALRFQREVLAADVLYHDAQFAALRGFGSEWMLHADSTYDRHPLRGVIDTLQFRGGSAELRLHGRDPDEAAAAATKLNCLVLQAPQDKPHGLREAYLLDPDGYLWVPDIPIAD
jgi:catechol 2,3-dioxygenase-like lactoylglutathione lyase family enzyme